MKARIYNFNAGPAALPLPVLEEIQEEILNFKGSGMSVTEVSHRSKWFDDVIEDAVARVKHDNIRFFCVTGDYYNAYLGMFSNHSDDVEATARAPRPTGVVATCSGAPGSARSTMSRPAWPTAGGIRITIGKHQQRLLGFFEHSAIVFDAL